MQQHILSNTKLLFELATYFIHPVETAYFINHRNSKLSLKLDIYFWVNSLNTHNNLQITACTQKLCKSSLHSQIVRFFFFFWVVLLPPLGYIDKISFPWKLYSRRNTDIMNPFIFSLSFFSFASTCMLIFPLVANSSDLSSIYFLFNLWLIYSISL